MRNKLLTTLLALFVISFTFASEYEYEADGPTTKYSDYNDDLTRLELDTCSFSEGSRKTIRKIDEAYHDIIFKLDAQIKQEPQNAVPYYLKAMCYMKYKSQIGKIRKRIKTAMSGTDFGLTENSRKNKREFKRNIEKSIKLHNDKPIDLKYRLSVSALKYLVKDYYWYLTPEIIRDATIAMAEIPSEEDIEIDTNFAYGLPSSKKEWLSMHYDTVIYWFAVFYDDKRLNREVAYLKEKIGDLYTLEYENKINQVISNAKKDYYSIERIPEAYKELPILYHNMIKKNIAQYAQWDIRGIDRPSLSMAKKLLAD